MQVEGVTDPARARAVLREELIAIVDPTRDRALAATGTDGKPGVVLVVGVNGTGKTTTVGRIARVLVAEDKSVVLGAADTFRAAAADQLQTWGERVGVPTVRGPEGGDPASVGFEAVQRGIADGVDVVLVDTAGRLHTKSGLMDELGKVKRVIEKQAPVTEVLLVIDATTGQNGLTQARVFGEVVDVTGIVLTKLDGIGQGRHRHCGADRARSPGEVRRTGRGCRRPGTVRRRGVRRRAAGLTAGAAKRGCNTTADFVTVLATRGWSTRNPRATTGSGSGSVRLASSDFGGFMDTGDTAWILASSALVLLMTPGLAFFYGGMVRSKTVLNMMMMSFAALAIVPVLWVLYGYSITFSPGGNGLLGGFERLGLDNISVDTLYGTIPEYVFVGFQLMFAIITVALISGAIADRAKFAAWVVFIVVWVSVVYFPVAHWVFDFGDRRRLDRHPARGDRLRRRHRGAHQRRRGGSRARAGARQAGRLEARPDASAQPAVRAARRRPAVVRLVRLQRRLGRSAPTASRLWPSSTPLSPRAPRSSAGSWWSRCATRRPRASAQRPVRWPDSSRSPRPPVRSRRSARSSWASSPACSAPWRSA